MKTITYLRYIGLAVVAALTLVCFSPSNSYAQYRHGGYNNGYGYSNAESNGYRLGFGAGSNDRARGASYDVDRNKAYRDGDSGYNGGGKDEYRAVFRQAYERGYSAGYNSQNGRYNRNNGRYNDRRYYDRYDHDRYDRRYDHRYDRRYRY